MPLLWISISFILGIVISSLIPSSSYLWLGIGLVVLLLAFIVSQIVKRRNISLPDFQYILALSLLVAFIIGAWRYQAAQPNIDAFHVAFYNDRDYEMLVTGTLTKPPDYRDTYTNLRLNVEAIDSGSGDLPASGLMLVRVPAHETYEYGQRVRVRGKLETPPEDEEFSYRDYLARGGVYSYMSIAEVTVLPGNGGSVFYTAVYKLKEKLIQNTYRLFNDPESSLLAGILFGVDTGLTRDLQNAFKNTGTAHIIAISGFNMAIIASVFYSIFKNVFGERYGALFAIIGIILYTILVGAEAAVVRAAVMGCIALIARVLGRKQLALNTLLVVAGFMCLVNPFFVWDVGFQLSFFATLGLILYAEPFSSFTNTLISKISKHDTSALTRIINDNVVLTFAAQLTTIPIMAYHFKRISLVSFIANPFILPVQPAVMILSGLAVFTSLVIYPLGQLLAWIAWPFATYTIRMVELFDRVPHGTIFLGDSSFWLVLFFYVALLTVTFNWSAIKEKFNSLAVSLRAIALTATAAFLFICTILLWRASASTGDGQLHITFLDAGSANAVLIQTPEGRNVLINGGASTTELSDELGRRLPFFSRRLDWLVVASTNEDELSALPRVLERYPPENVLWSGNIQASFSAQTLDKFFADEGIPVSRAEVGQRLELGDGAFIEVQAEGPRGSVLLLQYKNFRALFPIGISEGTYELLEYGNVIDKVDVLLLADSGYAPSNPPDIFENLNPQLVVLSVSAGDEDGLPSQDVLDSLDGYSLLRTDRSGWISVITDGNAMHVEVERSE
ncbi:MAG: ComEC/Rec2 family competence protein [Anaerolineales bacterium]|nr:ComEC/Rec2 family competence protein [Anaerolineales bacterium]